MNKHVLFGALGVVVLGLVTIIGFSVKNNSASIEDSAQLDAILVSKEAAKEDSASESGAVESDIRAAIEPEVHVLVPEVEPIPREAPIVIEYAPDFTLAYLDGDGTFTLSDFRGKKPVIVDFFAEHCPNCRRNLPKMEKLAAQYGDQVEVILIGIDSEAATRRYFAKRPTTLSVVMQDNRVAQDYLLRFTNTKAFINRDGSLRGILEGRDILEDHFVELIGS